MKKLLAAFLFMPLIVFSQNKDENTTRNFQAECLKLDQLESILSEFDELPVLRGQSFRRVEGQHTENSLIIFVNSEKNTWTIVEKITKDQYCIIAVGGLFGVVSEKIRQDLIKQRQRSRS